MQITRHTWYVEELGVSFCKVSFKCKFSIVLLVTWIQICLHFSSSPERVKISPHARTLFISVDFGNLFLLNVISWNQLDGIL